MQASVYRQYGQPEVLKIQSVKLPVPQADEILVQVRAATVNRTDCAMLLAKPFIMRIIGGFFKPRKPILGTDFAGVVKAVGEEVTRFKVGDRIFGFDDSGLQSHAEYLTISEKKAIGIIPSTISFEQAAASIEGGHYAYNFINKVTLNPGDKILVNGADGAIGSAAIQLSKYYQASVTAVVQTKNMELAKTLGADQVISYQEENFTHINERFHFVFDAVGKSTFRKCKPLLHTKGVYISSELGPYVQNPFLALLTPLLGGKRVAFPIPLNPQASVNVIRQLLDEGHFQAVIDRTYPLEQTADAFHYVLTGKKTGNVVLRYP